MIVANVFDTETTGLLKPSAAGLVGQPYIVEIYVAKLGITMEKIEFLGEYEQIVKPPVPLSAKIQEITGLTNEDVKGKPAFAEIAGDLAQFFVGADAMVAHNLPFDRGVLANEMMRADMLLNFPWPPLHICTIESSMKIEQRRMSLTNLHKHLTGREFENAHRAKNDVQALVRVFNKLLEKGYIPSLAGRLE